MFGVENTLETCRKNDYHPANWEADIHDILVEVCDHNEDPSGFRVVFYHSVEEDGYRIGASYLKNRLLKLTRAGLDAPMTKKAIGIVDQKRLRFS